MNQSINTARPLVCPQCGDKRFFIKQGDRYVVYEVLGDKSIRFVKEEDSATDIDTEQLACLGCSWRGSIRKLVKYLIVR